MTKYKLINREGKETLCDKVTIEGYDYYVSDEKRLIDDFYIGIGFMGANVFKWHHSQEKEYPNQKGKVIATTNPSLDIPKVVDEVEKFENEYFKDFSWGSVNPISLYKALRAGYNKSQETHPFSKRDVIDFNEWQQSLLFSENPDWLIEKSTEELLQIWEEERIKTIHCK